jgi:hypothetical protein
MDRFNPITEGLIKAMGFLAEAGSRRPKTKFIYEPGEPSFHATVPLTNDERLAVKALQKRLKAWDLPNDERRDIRNTLHTYGMRLRGTLRQIRIDYSRYQGSARRVDQQLATI